MNFCTYITRLIRTLHFSVLVICCCGIYCGASLAGDATARKIALVIGNAMYAQGSLANPVNDARAMATRLRTLGFDVILRENLKMSDIGGVYREFRSKIAPGNVALVFYAGHGVQFKGQNYFPAVDSLIHSEEDVPLQSLNLGSLLDNMEEAKAGVSLVFLDACRDNPFARSFRSASRGLAKVEAASGTLIHYATKPGSVAADGVGKNGTYTEALLAQMSEPGVPVEMMLKRVANMVVAKTNGKQEPWVEGSLRGDFYFQGPTVVEVRITPSGQGDSDAQTWNAAQQVNSANAYQAYLNAFPGGKYAVAASIKLDGLKQVVVPLPPAEQRPPAPLKAEPLIGRPTPTMSPSKRYSTVGNFPITDCVKDETTGLTWEGKPAAGQRASGNEYSNWGDGSSGDASSYMEQVNVRGLCGYTDWRLPTKDELTGLVVEGVSPTINVTWFPNTVASWYWTSSPYKDIVGIAWVVFFSDGVVSGGKRGGSASLRLVR